MAEKFGFGIAESLSLARDIIACKTKDDHAEWKRVGNYYRRRKRLLIKALCPETARREFSVEVVCSPVEAKNAYIRACRELMSNASAENADHMYHALDRWSGLVGQVDIVENAVQSNSYLFDLVAVQNAKIKKGMKLSRALAAYLEEVDKPHKGANVPRVVDLIDQKAQTKKRSYNFCISANPVDILFCSEHAGYQSCHGLDGGCRAGPQQYLADDCTVVVYAWKEWREWHGYLLPFKIFRQMVYLDPSHASAALQRHYGEVMHEQFYEAVRKQVAMMLARLAGKEEADLKWYRSSERPVITTGCELAYLDSTVSLVQLEKGDLFRPQIRFPKKVPCSACTKFLDNTEKLLCNKCDRSRECRHCGNRFRDRELRTHTGRYYCAKCWPQCFQPCHRCLGVVSVSCLNYFAEEDGQTRRYCSACYRAITVECSWCGFRHAASTADKLGCSPTCAGVLKNKLRLYERLKSSPAWKRANRTAKIHIRRIWFTRLRIGTIGSNHFPIPHEEPVYATA